MFYADFHVHSRFSRATSREANLEQYSLWARMKGLSVLATGDFTHPGWMKEIREQLVPAEPGLFRLRPEIEARVEKHLPQACREAIPRTRFLLEVEISTIYKKGDRTRKVHHIILVPDFDKADRFTQKLSRIGNLASDGRPILGLDSHHLLESTLESGEGCYLIPAHIWTPWFSVLGSKSGFDAIADCYGDLASHIFAAETGLSSDPLMNWRVSSLDPYRLVSNSDAHSPSKLGREACVFDCDTDYFAMRRALETGRGYAGTVEFFPEEGKYHVDGHRQCGVRLSPEETKEHKGLCPKCGKPVTVGVMNRVEELADRLQGFRSQGAAPFRSFVPLPEIVSEILGVGPGSGKVENACHGLLSRLGPEFFILEHAPLDAIERAGSAMLKEAVDRMRKGRVICEAGYDGEYGVIRLFTPAELEGDLRTGLLFEVPSTKKARSSSASPAEAGQKVPRKGKGLSPHDSGGRSSHDAAVLHEETKAQVKEAPPDYGSPELFGLLDSLDPDQRTAAEIVEGPLLIIAGPGTGKTRTLTHRIAHLISDRGAVPERCLAITFTLRAAREMKERLQQLLPGKADRIPVMTFHAFGHSILRQHTDKLGLPASFRVADEKEAARVLSETLKISARGATRRMKGLSHEEIAKYREAMRERSLVDFDDLIRLPVELLDSNLELVTEYRQRYRWISVDEFQDIDEDQYRLIRQLTPADGNLCVIGDPDQAIYGFRGTDVRFFQRFSADFPGSRTVELTWNYRSGKGIVNASLQVIAPASLVEDRALQALADDETKVTIHGSATDKAEAEFVVHTIEQLIGGSTFFSRDSGRVETEAEESYSFSDFAILYRTDAQASALIEALARSGMPFQKRSHVPLAEAPFVEELTTAMQGMDGEWKPTQRLDQAAAELPPEALLTIQALRSVALKCGDMGHFLSELAMTSDVDLWDPRADAISLLTLHASKGLEFPVVFIVGCEDGLLPLRWGTADDRDTSEERRLFFVGMTRARRRLFLSHARKRLWMGKLRDMDPSPFLKDIQEQLLERHRAESHRQSRPSHQQLDLF
jgi:DNA helicase-2/ATP-dependent DNA helicase PcrA